MGRAGTGTDGLEAGWRQAGKVGRQAHIYHLSLLLDPRPIQGQAGGSDNNLSQGDLPPATLGACTCLPLPCCTPACLHLHTGGLPRDLVPACLYMPCTCLPTYYRRLHAPCLPACTFTCCTTCWNSLPFLQTGMPAAHMTHEMDADTHCTPFADTFLPCPLPATPCLFAFLVAHMHLEMDNACLACLTCLHIPEHTYLACLAAMPACLHTHIFATPFLPFLPHLCPHALHTHTHTRHMVMDGGEK